MLLTPHLCTCDPSVHPSPHTQMHFPTAAYAHRSSHLCPCPHLPTHRPGASRQGLLQAGGGCGEAAPWGPWCLSPGGGELGQGARAPFLIPQAAVRKPLPFRTSSLGWYVPSSGSVQTEQSPHPLTRGAPRTHSPKLSCGSPTHQLLPSALCTRAQDSGTPRLEPPSPHPPPIPGTPGLASPPPTQPSGHLFLLCLCQPLFRPVASPGWMSSEAPSLASLGPSSTYPSPSERHS